MFKIWPLIMNNLFGIWLLEQNFLLNWIWTTQCIKLTYISYKSNLLNWYLFTNAGENHVWSKNKCCVCSKCAQNLTQFRENLSLTFYALAKRWTLNCGAMSQSFSPGEITNSEKNWRLLARIADMQIKWIEMCVSIFWSFAPSRLTVLHKW